MAAPLTQIPSEPEALTALVRSVRPAPVGVPQGLWDEALAGPVREFLARPGKRFRYRLVELSWKACGGEGDPPAALPLLVELFHAGSLIVDDIEDDSVQRRGQAALHRMIGLPLALNTGNWLYFWPLSLIRTLGLPAAMELALHRRSADAIRRCHEGQALDLAARVGDLHPGDVRNVALAISEQKTGSLMSLAAAAGAIAAGADETAVEAFASFGERLGVGLQMQNDLSELTGAAGPLKHPEDLLHGRVTWPWAWAAQRLSAPRFDALQARGARLASGSGDAAALARDLLAALGDDPGRPVEEWLASAMGDLAREAPAGAALDEIQAELHRLETRYA
ncbi:MAG: polyprenyl synthetase family protein [Gemmataceae bacterium]